MKRILLFCNKLFK